MMKEYPLDRMMRVAIALSSEKDFGALTELILKEAMDYTGCDGGTVYICDKKHLIFYSVITRSKGVCLRTGRDTIKIPPVPLTRTHVCACAALDNKRINIDDVYLSADYSFDGTKAYDERNNYRTQSMLVVPMEDDQSHVIGVLQLINALDDDGNITPFPKACEGVIEALASLAAVTLNNRRLSKQVFDLLHSLVHVMVSAIDMRSPYNANHTRSMVTYAESFIRWLRETDNPEKLRDEDEDPFLMSVWLHDIGKLIVPLEVMDKSTRLGSLEAGVESRIQIALLCEEVRGLKNPEELADADHRRKELELARSLIRDSNTSGTLSEERILALKSLEKIQCLTPDGSRIPLLTEDERAAITVPQGTLTEEERHEMENHVVYTSKMLADMKLEGVYEQVPFWAGAHHELLDGSGYPERRTGQTLPREVRILTIIDIYDALTADDRPYKPPMPPEAAFAVLEGMSAAGRIDGRLVSLFKESGAWKRTDR